MNIDSSVIGSDQELRTPESPTAGDGQTSVAHQVVADDSGQKARGLDVRRHGGSQQLPSEKSQTEKRVHPAAPLS